jgi:hypothetical protein
MSNDANEIRVMSSASRDGWNALDEPPGVIPSAGRELDAFISADGRFTTGFWEREPDTWAFERPYDEVALILSGVADIETDDGRTLRIGAGDLLITPKGSKGTWHIHETIVKLYAIHESD